MRGFTSQAFVHYLQFWVMPGTLCLGIVLVAILAEGENGSKRMRTPVAAIAILLPCFGIVAARGTASPPAIGSLVFDQAHPRGVAAQVIRNFAGPDDAMSLWGWRNRYYVEAGLRMGTHEAFTATQAGAGNLTAYYRRRYLADLERNRPVVWVDASIAPEFGFVTDEYSPERCFPELMAWINQHYRMVGLVEQNQVFVRNDRLTPTAR